MLGELLVLGATRSRSRPTVALDCVFLISSVPRCPAFLPLPGYSRILNHDINVTIKVCTMFS